MISGNKMRDVASIIKKELPNNVFTLLVFNFNKPGISHYISNADRQSMIKALEETLSALKNKKDFNTPELN